MADAAFDDGFQGGGSGVSTATTDLTYLELRQRVTDQLNRDDLDTVPLSNASIVHQFVKERVNHYKKEFFYNAQFTDLSKKTIPGGAFVNLPDGWQQVNFVRYTNDAQLLAGSGLWLPIREVPYEYFLHMDVTVPATRGPPSVYSLYQNPTGGKMAIRMFPVPGEVYRLEFTLDKPPDAPSSDGEISFWTCDAQSLIIESVCEAICRRRISRPVKADEHRVTKEEAELALTSKTIRIKGGIRAKFHW